MKQLSIRSAQVGFYLACAFAATSIYDVFWNEDGAAFVTMAMASLFLVHLYHEAEVTTWPFWTVALLLLGLGIFAGFLFTIMGALQ